MWSCPKARGAAFFACLTRLAKWWNSWTRLVIGNLQMTGLIKPIISPHLVYGLVWAKPYPPAHHLTPYDVRCRGGHIIYHNPQLKGFLFESGTFWIQFEVKSPGTIWLQVTDDWAESWGIWDKILWDNNQFLCKSIGHLEVPWLQSTLQKAQTETIVAVLQVVLRYILMYCSSGFSTLLAN